MWVGPPSKDGCPYRKGKEPQMWPGGRQPCEDGGAGSGDTAASQGSCHDLARQDFPREPLEGSGLQGHKRVNSSSSATLLVTFCDGSPGKEKQHPYKMYTEPRLSAPSRSGGEPGQGGPSPQPAMVPLRFPLSSGGCVGRNEGGHATLDLHQHGPSCRLQAFAERARLS